MILYMKQRKQPSYLFTALIFLATHDVLPEDAVFMRRVEYLA